MTYKMAPNSATRNNASTTQKKKNCWPVRNFLTFWTLFPKLVFFGNKENERRELAFGENWKIRQCQTSSFWAISLSQMGWIPLIIEDGAEENSFFTNRVLSCDACRKENSFFYEITIFSKSSPFFFTHDYDFFRRLNCKYLTMQVRT